MGRAMAKGTKRKSRPAVHCAIYTRKSSEEGLEQAFNSLDAQREACEAFIRHCHVNRSVSQLGQLGAKVRSRRWRFAKPRTMRFEVP